MIWLTDFYNVHCEYPEFEQDYTANKVRLKDIPSYVDSFRKMEDVSSNGFYNEDYLSTNREQAISMLAEGKGAHYCLLTRELVNVLAANYPDAIGDIGFFATPGNDPDKTGITVWMPHSWYIAKNASEDVKTALKLWMTYVTSHPHWHSLRSEENTSELQSLLQTSYAVSCWKKKKKEKKI